MRCRLYTAGENELVRLCTYTTFGLSRKSNQMDVQARLAYDNGKKSSGPKSWFQPVFVTICNNNLPYRLPVFVISFFSTTPHLILIFGISFSFWARSDSD
ncbi:hypothetical protein ACJBU6_08947 [Exserohilum turcicum]